MNLIEVTFPIPVGRFNANRVGASQMVLRGIRQGLLKKDACCVCGEAEKRVVAHHEDYAKPNTVAWLCEKHHKARHRELNWGVGGCNVPRRSAVPRIEPHMGDPKFGPHGKCIVCGCLISSGRQYCNPHRLEILTNAAQMRAIKRRIAMFCAYSGIPSIQ